MLTSIPFIPPCSLQTPPFTMFSMPAQRPRVPSTRSPVKMAPSTPLPAGSRSTHNTIRPVALYIYFVCAVGVPLVAYGIYSTFGSFFAQSV